MKTRRHFATRCDVVYNGGTKTPVYRTGVRRKDGRKGEGGGGTHERKGRRSQYDRLYLRVWISYGARAEKRATVLRKYVK